jgi:hypothetical protein
MSNAARQNLHLTEYEAEIKNLSEKKADTETRR